MNDRKQQRLRTELQAAGASAAEIKKLLPIASAVSLLKNSNAPKADSDKKSNRWLEILKPATFVSSGLVAGMLLVIISQAALPTSWLYPVQKASDNVAVNIQPQYRAAVMMKRAQQVNELTADHAAAQAVLATLADYTKEARTYKSMSGANYAAFEYCETNLRQAAVAAPPKVRQAIAASLQSLKNT